MRFIFLTMDGNHGAALREAAGMLRAQHGVDVAISLYNATTLREEADWQRLAQEIDAADFVFGSMLFGEEYVRPLQRVLQASSCPVCVITSNPALIRSTHLGKFDLRARETASSPSPLLAWARKFRPKGGHGEGQRQLAMLRNLGKIMKHIPGKARDLHTYIAVHDYWMNGSPENLKRMLCLLIDRYVPGYAGKLPQHDPIRYPDAAIYHPDAPAPFADLASYEKWRAGNRVRGLGIRNGSSQTPNPKPSEAWASSPSARSSSAATPRTSTRWCGRSSRAGSRRAWPTAPGWICGRRSSSSLAPRTKNQEPKTRMSATVLGSRFSVLLRSTC